MKRDMDFVRELLLKIENGQKVFETASTEQAEILGFTPETPLTREEADNLSGHLDLLHNAGFIEIEERMAGGTVLIRDLTWSGHDFLDSVRDPEVWQKTKEGASKAGAWTVELLMEVGKAYAKQKLKDVTGLEL
jgi:hypothetical protein